jgi:glucose 1-dehydrogenase
MKAVAVFPGTKRIDLIDQPVEKTLPASGVRLKMLEVGICGTDKEIASFQYGTPPEGSDYLVIGHESLAEIEETGPGANIFAEGDLVVSMVRRPCQHPECRPCRLGRQDFCVTGDYRERGIEGIHGFMTGHVIDDEKYLHRVPGELRDVGVLVEPLTIAEKAFFQLDTVHKRLPGNMQHDLAESGRHHTALILGAGPVGVLGCMALRTRGYTTGVFSRESPESTKAKITKAVGARYISAGDHTLQQVAEELGNIDVIYEATGASGLAFDAIQYLGTNAVFIFTGVPGRKGPVSVNTALLMRNMVLKNQVVLGTVNAGANAYEAAIASLSAFMQRWPDAVHSLITGRHPLEAFRDFFLQAKSAASRMSSDWLHQPRNESDGGRVEIQRPIPANTGLRNHRRSPYGRACGEERIHRFHVLPQF